MKKTWTLMVGLSLLVVTLTGCSIPFSDKSGEKLTSFIVQNVSVVDSSNQLEQSFMKDFKKKNKKAIKKTAAKKEILYYKDTQQEFYEQIKAVESIEETVDVKLLYLQYIDQKIKSAERLYMAAKQGDNNVVAQVIEENEKKNEGLEKSINEKINKILTSAGEEPQKDLFEKNNEKSAKED